MRRFRAVIVVAVVVLVAGSVVALLWRGRPGAVALAPVNNVAGNFRACLVVPSGGSAASRAVWGAMQHAAATGRVNAQQFPAPGSTGRAAVPYLNGVVGVGCDVVVVAEKVFVPGVRAAAAKAKQQHFLIVGAGTSAGNVEVVADAVGVSGWIASHVGG